MWKLEENCVSRCGFAFRDELTLTKFQTKLRNAGKEADESVKRARSRIRERREGRREGQEKALFPNIFKKFFGFLRAPKKERRESGLQTLVSLPAWWIIKIIFSAWLSDTSKSFRNRHKPSAAAPLQLHSQTMRAPKRRISAQEKERLGVQESQGLILRICSTREFSTKKNFKTNGKIKNCSSKLWWWEHRKSLRELIKKKEAGLGREHIFLILRLLFD